MPEGAVDLADARELLEAPGPYLSVYLPVDPAIENTAVHHERALRELHREMSDGDVPMELVDEVLHAMEGDHRFPGCAAVIATGDRILLHDVLPLRPSQPRWRWSPLPVMAPLVEARQMTLTCVVVLADRVGADIYVGDGWNLHHDGEAGGDEMYVNNTSVGGWAQRRYQQRTRETWRRNASDAADATLEVVEREAAEVILLGGDVRAVELVTRRLPQDVLDRVVQISPTRAADGSGALVPEEAHRAVATAAARKTVEMLHVFREELGQHDLAVDGGAPTLRALSGGQVAILLLHDDPDDRRTAWFAPGDPLSAALSPGDLVGNGGEPQEAPLVDVALRSAVLGGAAARVLPSAGGPAEGIGALLRWAQ